MKGTYLRTAAHGFLEMADIALGLKKPHGEKEKSGCGRRSTDNRRRRSYPR